MPSKKKKYNARFPAGRIKKIMQTDEEVGKVAQAVPVIISRTLELFVESLLVKSMQITQSRNAKTLTPSHMKQCILSESRFDFLKDLVKNIPDASAQEDNENNALFEASFINNKFGEDDDLNNRNNEMIIQPTVVTTNQPLAANFYTEQSTSSSSSSTTTRTPIIQYGPQVVTDRKNHNFSTVVNNFVGGGGEEQQQPKLHITVAENNVVVPQDIPPLIPISQNFYAQNSNTDDNLCIDEDYDN